MGITINWKLQQKKNCVKKTLDRAEQVAREYQKQAKTIDVPFTIQRPDDYKLFIDIGNCETLGFLFKSKEEIMKAGADGWDYIHAVLTEDGTKELDNGYAIDKYPQNEIYFCSGFTKTQYAKSLSEHRYVAEILRVVASYCTIADVSDEGDYYHSADINDASEAIASLGKMINKLGTMLADNFGTENIAKGGDTIIKSPRKRNK